MPAVVETETRNLGLFGPIGLRLAEHGREQREHEQRRMLSGKHRITRVTQSEFLSERRNGLRLVTALHHVEEKLRKPWSKHPELAGPLPERRHGHIVSGEERKRREHTRDPRYSGFASDEWTSRRGRMRNQKVRILHCREQIGVAI